MLVLTRKLQQQIQIGDHVTITILQVKGGQVRIGIEAPKNVRIVRSELERFSDEPAETGSAAMPPTVREAGRQSKDKPGEAFSSPTDVRPPVKREIVNRVAEELRRQARETPYLAASMTARRTTSMAAR